MTERSLGELVKVSFNEQKELKPVVMTPTVAPVKFSNNQLVNNKRKGQLRPALASKIKDNSPYNER